MGIIVKSKQIKLSLYPQEVNYSGPDHFNIVDGAAVINNGRCFYNLPLHCSGSRTLINAGSRPAFMMFNSRVVELSSIKFGEFMGGLETAQHGFLKFSGFQNVETKYSPGTVSYELNR